MYLLSFYIVLTPLSTKKQKNNNNTEFKSDKDLGYITGSDRSVSKHKKGHSYPEHFEWLSWTVDTIIPKTHFKFLLRFVIIRGVGAGPAPTLLPVYQALPPYHRHSNSKNIASVSQTCTNWRGGSKLHPLLLPKHIFIPGRKTGQTLHKP